MSLLPVAQAQARLLALAPQPTITQADFTDAVGHWTAQDVAALRSQPALDLSAMDGYAIRLGDMPGPWHIIGESAAGDRFTGNVGAGEAVRIYTGAAMPTGTDCVVVQEDVQRKGDTLTLSGEGPTRPGHHVRYVGSDFAKDRLILPQGSRIGPRQIALAALAGHAALPVYRRPRIALLSSGSELVAPGEPTLPDQIPASNGVMLGAMLADMPCDVTDVGIIRDDLTALTDALHQVRGHDIILSTGGASVGDHDLIKPALEAAGGNMDFWKIRMRPGKPLICGQLRNAVFLGLPGNPVSAFVTAHLFLLPLVRHLLGCPTPLPAEERGILGVDMPAVGGRDDYVRAVPNKDGRIIPLSSQDSAATHGLSLAEYLMLCPAESAPALAGEQVTLLPI